MTVLLPCPKIDKVPKTLWPICTTLGIQPCAYAIHDGLLNDWGLKVLESILNAKAAHLDADIRPLKPGDSVEI